MSTLNQNQMFMSGFQATPKPEWNGLAPMLETRHCHAAVPLDENRLMVMGGYGIGVKRLKSVIVYDKTTKEWSRAGWPELNEKRSAHSAVIYNNIVYVFGGANKDDHNNYVYLSSIECLDLSRDTLKWVTLEQQCRRAGCAAVVVGTFIYIIGGNDGESTLSSVEVFDTKTGIIIHQDHPSMTTERSKFGAALVGNKIWAVGGSNQDRNVLNTVEYLEVNLVTGMPVGEWTTSATTVTLERSWLAVTVVGHCLVIMGGYDNNNNYLSSVEVLDTERGMRWVLPNMSVPRYGCAAVTLGESNIVVLGGCDNYMVAHDPVESLTITFKGVSTLFELCESKCIETLTINNIKDYVTCAHFHGYDHLLGACFEFIRNNSIDVVTEGV